MMDYAIIEDQYSSGVYAKRDITIVSGHGATLVDADGNTYIDCVGGQGAANLGHNHPKLVTAIQKQAAVLINCPEMFHNDRRANYMQALLSVTPPGFERVFLCNSGTESIEAAIKFARAFTGRSGVVAAKRGFHGRTMGALSATWNKKYRQPFIPLVPDFSHITFNDISSLDEEITKNTAAVMLEIVQGEGGVYPIDPEFLQAVRERCDQTGALLIVDEVQTGFGRTGKLFAIQHFNVQADMICIAKSMGGGIPMGAVLIGEKLGELQTGIHGSTFGGNPLACAAANEVLNIFRDEKLSERAAELGAYFLEQLRTIESPLIRDIRGIGLMIGIELKQKVAPYIKKLMEKGVLALPAGLTTLRFLPPLVIEKEQLDQVVRMVSEILAENDV
jgi:acetylornithine/LysW-gamma-L-lysine aminotransferase